MAKNTYKYNLTDDFNMGFSREQMREFQCPRCGAEPHRPCLGLNGQPRVSNHRDRNIDFFRTMRREIRQWKPDPVVERSRYVSREDARTVDCPACGAAGGQYCLTTRGSERQRSHRERQTAFYTRPKSQRP